MASPEDEQPKQAGRTSAGTSEHSVILSSGTKEKKWPPILSSPNWRRQVTQRAHYRHLASSRPKRGTVEESFSHSKYPRSVRSLKGNTSNYRWANWSQRWLTQGQTANMCERTSSFDYLCDHEQKKEMSKGNVISMFEINRNKRLPVSQAQGH